MTEDPNSQAPNNSCSSSEEESRRWTINALVVRRPQRNKLRLSDVEKDQQNESEMEALSSCLRPHSVSSDSEQAPWSLFCSLSKVAKHLWLTAELFPFLLSLAAEGERVLVTLCTCTVSKNNS